jgi:hypothetical protein
MFSGLSKLADKSFVLGFFLPALVGVIAFIGLNRDIRPFTDLLKTSQQAKAFADLTVMLLVVWTLSVLLMANSCWMYRVLEGYAWPLNRPALKERQLKRRKQQRETTRAVYAAMTEAEKLPLAPEEETARLHRLQLLEECQRDYLGLKRSLALDYPAQRGLVLPTRFGNVLRAFEMYAGEVYGVESIHAWPRLLAVVPKDYQTTLADARAPVDFFVSLVFISFTLGVVALVRGAAAMLGKPIDAMPSWVFFCIAGGALVPMRLCYLAALSSAVAWGEVVKSAFDLYLPALARALGYKLPATFEERRRFWDAFANQFQFHEPVQPEEWPTTADTPLTADYPPGEDAVKEGETEDENGRDKDSNEG